MDDGGDTDDPTESAGEWRHRVLRLVAAKCSLTVCTVAGEVFQKDGGDRGRPDHPVPVPTPTAHLYAVYGRSLAMAATHTEAEQVGTVNVLILVQNIPSSHQRTSRPTTIVMGMTVAYGNLRRQRMPPQGISAISGSQSQAPLTPGTRTGDVLLYVAADQVTA